MPTGAEGHRANRIYAFIGSLAASALAVFAAYAIASGLDLGLAKSKPKPAPVTARAQKLDAYAESLRRSLAKRPPRLPAVPRYPAVTIPSVPSMPAVAQNEVSATVQTNEAPEETPGETTEPKRPRTVQAVPAPSSQVAAASAPTVQQAPAATQQVAEPYEREDPSEYEGHESDREGYETPSP